MLLEVPVFRGYPLARAGDAAFVFSPALGRGEMRDAQLWDIPAHPVASRDTLCQPLLSPLRVCQLVVPISRQRSQTRVRHRGQQVLESRHSSGSPDLNISFARLSGRGEIAAGMKISFRGWEREDYGLPSASMLSTVNNNKKGNDPQVP